jgi:hypothetical protein
LRVSLTAHPGSTQGFEATRKCNVEHTSRCHTIFSRHVNGVEAAAKLKAQRHSLACGTPSGATRRRTKLAAMLGLESSLQPRGRPKQQKRQMSFCDSLCVRRAELVGLHSIANLSNYAAISGFSLSPAVRSSGGGQICLFLKWAFVGQSPAYRLVRKLRRLRSSSCLWRLRNEGRPF